MVSTDSAACADGVAGRRAIYGNGKMSPDMLNLSPLFYGVRTLSYA